MSASPGSQGPSPTEQGPSPFSEQDPTENYADYLQTGAKSISNLLMYFQERAKIEAKHAQNLEELSKKALMADAGVTKYTSSEAARRLYLGTKEMASCFQMLADHIASTVVPTLQIARDSQKTRRHTLKKDAHRVYREYAEVAHQVLPRRREAYLKRCRETEASEALVKDPGSKEHVAKATKMQRELQMADSSYRHAVEAVEDQRHKLVAFGDVCRKGTEAAESERIAVTEAALTSFIEADDVVTKKYCQVHSELNQCTININMAVDLALVGSECERLWPQPQQVFYEHAQRGTFHDLAFGVGLTLHTRLLGVAVPPVLEALFKAIEANGLQVEGIYRISGRVTEVQELRARVEQSLASTDLLSPDWDIHAIAGLAKTYLRELPEAVCPFTVKERAEYAAQPDDDTRLLLLQNRVQSLPPAHQDTLRRLLDHIALVAQHASTNKMVVYNLSRIFGPILFSNGGEASSTDGASAANAGPGSTGLGALFRTATNSFHTSESPTREKVDIALLESLKNDRAFEEMVLWRRRLLPPAEERRISADSKIARGVAETAFDTEADVASNAGEDGDRGSRDTPSDGPVDNRLSQRPSRTTVPLVNSTSRATGRSSVGSSVGLGNATPVAAIDRAISQSNPALGSDRDASASRPPSTTAAPDAGSPRRGVPAAASSSSVSGDTGDESRRSPTASRQDSMAERIPFDETAYLLPPSLLGFSSNKGSRLFGSLEVSTEDMDDNIIHRMLGVGLASDTSNTAAAGDTDATAK